MAVTNAKNNFLDKLFGTQRQKIRQAVEAQEEELTSPLPQRNYMPQAIEPAGNPINPAQAQPNPQSGEYRFMEMVNPKPERETEREDIIKKRAKMNAFGRGLGALGQLVGVASGGDAQQLVDGQTPWNLNQIQSLDQDYRRRLQDWTNQNFQVASTNNAIQNRAIEQDIAQQNRLELEDVRTGNDMGLIGARGEQTLKGINARTDAEIRQSMLSLGIDPDAPNAKENFLEAQKNQVKIKNDYDRARTSYNNRYGNRSQAGEVGFQYDIPTLQAGKQALLNELAQKRAGLDPLDPANQAALKQIEELEEMYREYNPGKNPMIDAEIMNRGIKEIEGQAQGPASQDQAQQGAGYPYQPGSGMAIPQTQAPKQEAQAKKQASPEVASRITSNLDKVKNNTATDEDFEVLLQDIVDSGDAKDVDEALDLVIKFLKTPNQ